MNESLRFMLVACFLLLGLAQLPELLDPQAGTLVAGQSTTERTNPDSRSDDAASDAPAVDDSSFSTFPGYLLLGSRVRPTGGSSTGAEAPRGSAEIALGVARPHSAFFAAAGTKQWSRSGTGLFLLHRNLRV